MKMTVHCVCKQQVFEWVHLPTGAFCFSPARLHGTADHLESLHQPMSTADLRTMLKRSLCHMQVCACVQDLRQLEACEHQGGQARPQEGDWFSEAPS